MSDTLLLFHGAFLMAKRFKSYNKDECINLLNELIKNYPQTPYSEIASGYLRVIKGN
jgi:outer membrane protein assembly factor BamD (BamD/ComL family)